MGIGYGVNTLKEIVLVTHETCYIYNYTKIACQDGGDESNVVYNDFKYDYIVTSPSKCDNITLHRRIEETYNDECGVKNYDIDMNISCYIGDCNENEYSLIGFDHLSFDAKSDIELGCIVLTMTTVPFISFVCWVYFCYQCGPK